MKTASTDRAARTARAIQCAQWERFLTRTHDALSERHTDDIHASHGQVTGHPLDGDLAAIAAAIESVKRNDPDATAQRLCAGVTDGATHPLPASVATAAPAARASSAPSAGETVDARIARLAAEQQRLKAQAGRPTAPVPAAATFAPRAAATGAALTDHEATAMAEWAANKDDCRRGFSSEANFVAYRKAVLSGAHRDSTPVTQRFTSEEMEQVRQERDDAQVLAEWDRNYHACQQRYETFNKWSEARKAQLSGTKRDRRNLEPAA